MSRNYFYTLNTDFVAFESLFAMSFNGVDESIGCGNDASFDFEYTDSFSASFWAIPTNISLNRCVFAKIAAANSPGYYAYINTGAGLTVHIANSLSNYIRVDSPARAISADYYNYTFTYDGSGLASGVNIYFDGVAQSTTVLSDNLSSKSILNTEPFEIGERAGALFLDADLDDLSIIDKELSPTEVTELFGTGVPNDLRDSSFSGNLVSYWLMGDGDTIASITDVVGGNDGTPVNMDASNIIST